MLTSPVSTRPLTQPGKAHFFGLDLASLWRDLLAAWRDMLEWPVFAWAWPTQAVRVHLPTGGQAISLDLRAPLTDADKSVQSARFEAVLLPEDLLLRRTLELPKLQSAELEAAVTLEIQALSPFPATDVIWNHEIIQQPGNTLRVQVVLTSRKLIQQHAESVHAPLKLQDAEIWVARAQGPGFVMLPGFGEARRQRQSTIWRWTSVVLVLVALALLAAMAFTPSIKLYLRALQANQAMTSLGQKVSPAIAQREALVRLSDQLSSLALLTDKSVPPLQTLKLVTEALPDDTSLLTLQLQGQKVMMTGQTGNAAALMKQLGSTPGLRDVKAPAPATKPLGAPRESFTIEFTLDPAQLKPAS